MEDRELTEIDPKWESDDKEKIQEQEEQEYLTEEKAEEQWNQDPFTTLMFGPQGTGRPIFPYHGDSQQQFSPQQQGINYEELMENIDKLIDSTKGLKPLFQQIYPFIEQLWKKK
jgi:hypothetical protein